MSVELSKQLIALGLHYVAEHLDDVIAQATKHRWGTVEMLTHVAEHEAKGRAKGLAEGEARGEAKGRAATLLELLAARLGPKATRTLEPRLLLAAPAALRKLARVLFEAFLDNLFEGGGHIGSQTAE